jgi:uncharacterized protein (TIGR02145 family)
MADFKLNGITPDGVGKIKIGSTNVQEIYMGSTLVWPTSSPGPGPGEVQICDLIWTDTNFSGTELIGGGNLPIVTNQVDWNNNKLSETPCACYWNFDSNNSSYGLVYNYWARNAVKPPAGFRLPTRTDWVTIITSPCFSHTGGWFNRYGANPGIWDPFKLTNTTELGNSGLNIQGYGYGVAPSSTLSFTQTTLAECFWVNNDPSFSSGYGFFVNQGVGKLSTISLGDSPAYALFIRFVKDA